LEELVISGEPENHLMRWQHELLADGLQQVLQAK
jgi:hypothetical protein